MPLNPFTQNRSLSSEQGYELARVGTKMGLPVELQRLIWADVTKAYYSRGSVFDRAATVLQVAFRRLKAIIMLTHEEDLHEIGFHYSGAQHSGWLDYRAKDYERLKSKYYKAVRKPYY